MFRRRAVEQVGCAERCARHRVLVALVLGAIVAAAPAQYQIQQDGRLFDANPQVGGSRYNYARPVSPLIVSDAIISGNVRGGLGFQAYSPVGSPMAFQGPLGSSALGGFRRDSVSVADMSSPYGGLVPMPYYDPGQTAATGGFLAGQYGWPTVGPTSGGYVGPLGTSAYPGQLDLRVNSSFRVGPIPSTDASGRQTDALRSQIVGLSPSGSPELSSSIFGPPPVPNTQLGFVAPPRLADQRVPGLTRIPGEENSEIGRLGTYPPRAASDPLGSRPPLGTPLEMVQRGEGQWLPRETETQEPGAAPEPVTLGPVVRPPQPEDEPGRAPIGAPELADVPRLRDLSVLPGQDVFTDIQLGLALAANPGANWYQDLKAAVREHTTDAAVAADVAALQSQDFVQKFLGTPIRTLHGAGPSALNDELLKAESLVEVGQYYDAVRRYDVARSLDPLNPLPLIGKGHALLAAGDYLSAAVALVQGFERYPELTRFKYDLAALMGGGEVVDIRRADIKRRVEQHDDARLRFLLGYLEYYGGERESGLKNLDRAAQLDRSGSIISRFPTLLREEGKLPPPKLPSDTPGLPGMEMPLPNAPDRKGP